MKVVALLKNSISWGGGFNQALNAIVQMARLAEGNFEFVVLTSQMENISVLERLGIGAQFFKPNLFDMFISIITLSEFTRRIHDRLKLTSSFEKKVKNMGGDIVYFVEQLAHPTSLQCLNYITTVWDICHRDHPEFPEVRAYGEFHRRELFYKNQLAPAYLILVDSEELRDRIHSRYGIDKERMIVMPFAQNPMLDNEHSISMEEVLAHYRIEPGYFFYPAQFWAHKNHVRILEALVLLREKNLVHRLVFVGGDKGNLSYIHEVISKLNLYDQVSILGFVPTEHLRGLYQGAVAVVMPTYFGPTNIPPLEAWQLGKPLIYSKHLAEQCGKAARLVDPDDARTMADAMELVCNNQMSDLLCNLGRERLIEIDKKRLDAEGIFLTRLIAFKQRVNTWH